jgi:hypothetical protein
MNLLFLLDFNETSIFSTYFRKYSNKKFNENSCNGVLFSVDEYDEDNNHFSQICKTV